MPDLPLGFCDISRALPNHHPTWPGDPPLIFAPAARIAGGDSVNTSSFSTSTHTGTHVDAPWHYGDAAPKLDEVPLERYLGACLVVHVPPGDLVGAEALSCLPDPLPPRLLLYTGQSAEWLTFPTDFRALDPAFVREAARRGVRLIGTDSPSIDPLMSKTLDAHQVCLEEGILIVEGLDLSGVEAGEYTLICLPLPLTGADGAPARAVLLPAGLLP
ncbi:kynurenine formamidase [Deinococcus detaillensis]|uniref:Kynurenine formamidase n=1 Tax=Deinococcus detaillensis TaxID=2592048 RepID=A0A553URZ9_9DEIO|nr:cyclase family protein [Deinococcus detaillensis]TSA82996.1 kynurenine formamidase [Deinococcus detaillensis]